MLTLSYPENAPIAWAQMAPLAQRAAEQAAVAIARACASGDLTRAERLARAIADLALDGSACAAERAASAEEEAAL